MTAVVPPFDVNILCVDDDPKNLLALEAVLQADGRRLVHASSGAEALRHILDADFAVILLDVNMPGMDGFETAALIRDRGRSRDTPIIFLTAAIKGETHVARGYSLGAVDYLFKPLDADILRSKVAVFVDLFRKTELIKRQASQLAEATAFLNGVLNAASQLAIMALDPSGRLLAWNDGAHHLYGYSANETVGQRRIHDLCASDTAQQQAMVDLIDRAWHQGQADGVFPQVRRDNSQFIGSLVINHRSDTGGTPIGFVCVAEDITDRLRAEEERARLIEEQAARAQAEAARRHFTFLAEASSALASSLDSSISLQAMARVVVPTLADVCLVEVWDEPTANLRRAAVAVVAPPSMREQLEAALRQATGSAMTASLDRALRSARSRVYPELGAPQLAALVPDADSRECLAQLAPTSAMLIPLKTRELVLGCITLLMAGSERRFSSDDRTLVEDLADRVRLAMENARLYAEAQSAIQVRNEFLAAATHDLNTPLTVIKAQIQVLERRFSRLDMPDQERTLQQLHNAGLATNRMIRLVGQLLDVAQLQVGQPMQLDSRPIDLVALARGVVDELAEGSSHHVVRVWSSEPELVGQWDAARLERVLSNLVSNAIKYSPNGGEILLALSAPSGEGGSWVEVRVQDHGLGIPREDLPHVFDRFFRGRNVIGKIYGTGIGLAGARQIVEQHDGTIAIESELGQGTTVIIRLPYAHHPAPDSAESPG